LCENQWGITLPGGIAMAKDCAARTLAELWQSKCAQVPTSPGVYFVKAPEGFEPEFINNPGTGGRTGGRHTGKDPNVSHEILRSAWFLCNCCAVLYYGKGDNLRRRVWSYLRFGHGERASHWGGRYIWQIKHNPSLLLDWYEHDQPRKEEKRLLMEFERKHGRRPFANLTG